MMAYPGEIMVKLTAAVKEGHEDKVSNILSHLGVNYFRFHNSESQTLLCKSLIRGRTDICKLLLEYGAAVNNLALHLACVTGNKEMVEILIKDGEVDVNGRNIRHDTPLLAAVNLSKMKSYVSEIFDRSNDVLYKDQINNYCMNVSVEIAKILLDNGACVNLTDECKASPLHIACETGNLEGVRLLLKHNADFTLRNVSGKTPMHYCIERGSHHIYAVEIINLLVNKGAKVNAADNFGWTPLHCSTMKGYGNRVIPPPFDCSRLIRSIEITKYLLNSGASTRMKDFRGETPLHRAVKTENIEKVELILNRNPDIDSRDEKGETALYKANRFQNIDIAHLLLKYGANPNVQCNTGDTVLHCALIWREESVDLFLNYNADITIVNNKGDTPLDVALDLKPDHSCYSSRQTVLIHANKLKAANLALHDRSISSLRTVKDHKHNFFSFEKCDREVRLMKRSVIYNDITYYHILTASFEKLVGYLKNSNIEEFLSSEKYKTDFPTYADFLERKICRAFQRKRLICYGHEFFSNLDRILPKLSYDCVENVLNHLSDRDLTILRKCI